MSKLTIEVVEVTPDVAKEWLAKTAGNRIINEKTVLSYALAMEAGQWDYTVDEVAFDVNDKLVNGHHRLEAAILYGKPVTMAVKRGVSLTAKQYIDTGRGRTIIDQHHMYRPSVDYPNQRRAALMACIRAVVGSGVAPPLRTLAQWDHWMKHFRAGIDAAIQQTFAGSNSAPIIRAFGRGPVLGAFAFAHKLAPDKVTAFHRQAIDGSNLAQGSPGLVLRTLVLAAAGGARAKGEREEYTRRVLNLIYASVTGQKAFRSSASSVGRDYFLGPYDTKRMRDAIKPWAAEEEAEPQALSA